MRYKLSIILFLIPVLCYSQDFSFKEKKELKHFNDYIMQARFSPYRNYFAITVGDNSLEIYDKNWDKIFSYQGDPNSVGGHISFSPDEKYLAYAKYKSDNDIAIIDLESRKVIETLKGHYGHIQDIEWNHSGTLLASCSQDETVRVWEFDGYRFELLQVFEDHERSVSGISFSYDDKYLASAGNDSELFIYEWKSGKYKLKQDLRFKGYIDDVVFHPLNYRLLTGNSYGTFIVDFKKGEFAKTDSLDEFSRVNNIIEFSPKGDYFFHGNYTRGRIWREKGSSYELVESIYRHTDNVFGGSFSDDGKFLCTHGSDRQLIIWELTGVEPSNRSQLIDYLGWNPSYAQKRILTAENTALILSRLDANLTMERDEFETSNEFNQRRSVLSAQVLSNLQMLLEADFKLKANGSGELLIPLEELVGYNADLEIYKIRFMETEAGVEIPVNEAHELKSDWQDARITVRKKLSSNKISYDYNDFELIHPQNHKKYKLHLIQNPFMPDQDTRSTGRASEIKEVKDKPKSTYDEQRITHAVLFASNIYDSFSDLVNPVLDATTVAAEREENYNVHTEVIENPGLNDIMKKLRELASMDFGPEDNVLIYFAGHGEYDPVFREGYVIATDSKMDDPAKTSYLSHSNLRTIVNNIPCMHIFLVMDVCFGGTFDPVMASGHRGTDMYAEVSPEDFIERKMKYKTRLYLTSGGKEYVPDGRPGHHSPFTRKFLEALRQYGGNDKVLTVLEILQFLEKVEPQPRFGEFGDNEPGSDFILISK